LAPTTKNFWLGHCTGITSFSQEFTTPISPARMLKALMLVSQTLALKLMPQSIKSIEFDAEIKGLEASNKLTSLMVSEPQI
jgi:hypothetical protein